MNEWPPMILVPGIKYVIMLINISFTTILSTI